MRIAAVLLAVLPSIAFAGNYATCLLKNLPGLQNDAAAHAASRMCMAEYPEGMLGVRKGSGRGLFSYSSGAECAMKKAGETRSPVAGSGIYVACNKLYDEETPIEKATWMLDQAGRSGR